MNRLFLPTGSRIWLFHPTLLRHSKTVNRRLAAVDSLQPENTGNRVLPIIILNGRGGTMRDFA